MKNSSFLPLALKGMAMGIAEVIPGVSGGTIAFITGIYEKLLDTIKAFSPSLLGVFKKEGISGLWSCLLYTSPSPRDATLSRMPSSA